jgi:hypothetical protein
LFCAGQSPQGGKRFVSMEQVASGQLAYHNDMRGDFARLELARETRRAAAEMIYPD